MSEHKTKIYTGDPISGLKIFPILNRQLGLPPYTGGKPFRGIFDEMDFSFLERVFLPEDADFLVIPHYFSSIKDKKEYLQAFVELSKKYNKKITVFAYGDAEVKVSLPNATIFRYAHYRNEIQKNEIVGPCQVYDSATLKDDLFFLRSKSFDITRDRQEKPVVSFCGWGGLGTFRQKTRYFAGILPWDVRTYLLFDKHAEVHKQGIYWRKKALRALSGSSLVETSFVVRDFYSANKNTIKGNLADLRKEYVENIQNSDFVLTPRGDSNMAIRFYEALVLGRVPVVIDTDWVLPLEDKINYRDFVVFVPYTDIKNTDRYIREFWDRLSNEEFHAVQRRARETFMQYLKFDSYFRFIFQNVLKP